MGKLKFDKCQFLVPGGESEFVQVWLEIFDILNSKKPMRYVETGVENVDTVLVTCCSLNGIYRAYLVESNHANLTLRESLEWHVPSVHKTASYYFSIADSDDANEGTQFERNSHYYAIHQLWLDYILKKSLEKQRPQSQLRKLMNNKVDFAIVSTDNDSDGLGSPLSIIWKSPNCKRFVLNAKDGYYRHVKTRKSSK